MVRNERKDSNCFIIITTIIIVLCLLLISLVSKIKYYQDNVMELNKKLEEEYNIVSKDKNKLLEEKEVLDKKIDELENISTLTTDLKQEVFTLAKDLEQKIIKNDTKYKIAYLTFDDGPYYSTNDYLKILKKYRVKGTFFTIGLDKEKCFDNRNKDCSILYKKIVDEGHTIANHTYSHLIHKGLYSSATSFINQVTKQEKLIKQKTGVTTNIVRFPGGSGTANAYGVKNGAIKKLQSLGYGWVDWTAQDGDGGSPGTKKQALARFKKNINEGIEVVLLHDYSQVSLAILPDIIEYLEKNNYILLPLFYDSVKVNK